MINIIDILVPLYEKLSVSYGSFWELIENKNYYLDRAHIAVVRCDVEDAKEALLRDFMNVFKTEAGTQPVSALSAVKALNLSVMNRGNYSNVNDFLFDNNIRVCASWAYLCELAGFNINDSLIRDEPCLPAEIPESSGRLLNKGFFAVTNNTKPFSCRC